MTYLQAINWVLRKLREDTVSTYNESAYSTLIGDLVNEAKREVEDAWDWTALRTILSVTTANGTQNYTISGSNQRTRIKNAYNDTNDSKMFLAPHDFINNINYIGTTQSESPIYYRIRGVTSGEMDIDLYPTPNAVETIQLDCVVPQDDLAAGATVITVPEYPVIHGAYVKALSERGDDGGVSFDEAAAAYKMALSDAIGFDSNHANDELVWGVA